METNLPTPFSARVYVNLPVTKWIPTHHFVLEKEKSKPRTASRAALQSVRTCHCTQDESPSHVENCRCCAPKRYRDYIMRKEKLMDFTEKNMRE